MAVNISAIQPRHPQNLRPLQPQYRVTRHAHRPTRVKDPGIAFGGLHHAGGAGVAGALVVVERGGDVCLRSNAVRQCRGVFQGLPSPLALARYPKVLATVGALRMLEEKLA